MCKPTPQEMYSSLASHITNAEQVSWNRFNNFLLFNSVLILGWFALNAATTAVEQQPLLLAVSSCIGIISGLIWAGLGIRGRNNVHAILELGSRIECPDGNPPPDAPLPPFSKLKALRDSQPFKFCGSRYVLAFGPLLLSCFHVLLLWLSLSI